MNGWDTDSETDARVKAGSAKGKYRQCSIGWHGECSDPNGESCTCLCHRPDAIELPTPAGSVVAWGSPEDMYIAFKYPDGVWWTNERISRELTDTELRAQISKSDTGWWTELVPKV